MGNYKKIKHLKVLLPTLREKKRYILIEVIKTKKDNHLNIGNIRVEITKTLLKVFGVMGSGYFSFRFVRSKRLKQNQILIRVNNLSTPFLLSSLIFLNSSSSKGFILKVAKISGTIKSLFE